MCTRKKEITLPNISDWGNIWKMPHQMQSIYIKGGRPRMMTKCGQCYECKKERARNWTYKIWIEASNYENNCFITLTYKSNEKGKNLDKKELQRFIKKLRKKIEPTKIKYFAAGEYGEKRGRAHYHIIILNWMPPDLKKMHGARSKKNKDMWQSKMIHELWNNGRISVQQFAKNEVGYLTLYLNHNNEIQSKINYKEVKERKTALREIQIKHGIIEKRYNNQSQKWEYNKIKQIKNLTKTEHQAYKKDYNENVLNINEYKKQPEFNLSSKGMGFQTYIEKEYYKYELNIDNYTYERPKEFLRKIWENPKDFTEEIIEYNNLELEKRKKWAEENYIDTTIRENIIAVLAQEEAQRNDNLNKIKLNKNTESIF